MKDLHDYSLLHHNTFNIDARCRRFIEYENVEEAQYICKNLSADDQPLMMIGGGSNLLLTADFNGTVLHSAIKGIEVMSDNEDEVKVCVGSGVVWDDFVAYAVDHNWHGLENLSYIPGDVGASAVQNIGAYGVEAKDYIYKVEAIDIHNASRVTIDADTCNYSYRQSRFKQEWRGRFLITHVVFRLSKTFIPKLDYGNIRAKLQEQGIERPDARQMRDTIIDIRREKLPDPAVEGNAGSFFMNPVVSRSKYLELMALYPFMPHYEVDADSVKIPAGWMIEQCGWKGRSLGNAGVHSKQALVLVNRGGATGNEVVELCNAIRHDVKEKFGIDIHPEVNIIKK